MWTNLWGASLPVGPWVQLEHEYEIILRRPSYCPQCCSLCIDTFESKLGPEPSFSTEILPKLVFPHVASFCQEVPVQLLYLSFSHTEKVREAFFVKL